MIKESINKRYNNYKYLSTYKTLQYIEPKANSPEKGKINSNTIMKRVLTSHSHQRKDLQTEKVTYHRERRRSDQTLMIKHTLPSN